MNIWVKNQTDCYPKARQDVLCIIIKNGKRTKFME